MDNNLSCSNMSDLTPAQGHGSAHEEEQGLLLNITIGLHKDAAVRAQKSKDAAEVVSQEMADIVSALRADCQSLRVQRAEAEWQAKDWHTLAKVLSAAPVLSVV